MAPVIATTVIKDGAGNNIAGGVATLEKTGDGTTGPFNFINALVDGATGTTLATIKKASVTALATDPALVVGLNPLSNAVSQTGTWTAVVGGTAFVSGGTVTAVVNGTVTATATLQIAGAVVSSTNGLFTNLLQNNATLTPTNGAWVNVMFNNAIVSAAAGLPVNIVSGSVSVGAVTSSLNQAGAAISTTNGIWGNVMFNNAIVSASVGLPVNIVSGSISVGASVTAVVYSQARAARNFVGTSILTTNFTALAANSAVQYLRLQNTHTGSDIACAFGVPAIMNSTGSLVLGPGESIAWGPDTAGVPSGALNCIASVTTAPLFIEWI